jgi:4-carboxymuconolactone decarboxylase
VSIHAPNFQEDPMTDRPRLCGAGVLMMILAGLPALSQSLPSDVDPASRARLPYLQRDDLDAAGQEVFDMLPGAGPDGLGGPLAWAAYNPEVAHALLDLHNAAVGGILDAHVRELAILVACRETDYDLEWSAHEPSAVRAGVDQKVIDAVRSMGSLSGLPEADATVIRFGRQMYTDRKVDSDTFRKAVEMLTPRGVMDMVAVMNTYAVSGFFAIAVDEQPAPGQAGLER